MNPSQNKSVDQFHKPVMFCCIHKDWKHNVENPVCLYCENERYKAENDELRRAIKVLQSKG